MEETLGKRIAANRKHLGITQDRLAEQLGVTAQAVSKWENDQSCPDITMLPKLAAIFGISVDELLGVEPRKQEYVHEAEIVTEDSAADDEKHTWEVHWDTGRRGDVAISIWIILTAGWMFAARYLQLDISLWDLLWTNGLIVLGLSQLFKKFNFLPLGCALFGAYFLAEKLEILPVSMGRNLLLPTLLLLFGLSLLVDAMRTSHTPRLSFNYKGNDTRHKVFSYETEEDSFACDCAFGAEHQAVQFPLLCRGTADVSFGELTLDLSKCDDFSKGCSIDADCSFARLKILVPKWCRANVTPSTAFGKIDTRGSHDRNFRSDIFINADVAFGQIVIHYI